MRHLRITFVDDLANLKEPLEKQIDFVHNILNVSKIFLTRPEALLNNKPMGKLAVANYVYQFEQDSITPQPR
jgi:hypothetical protein